MIPTSPFKGNIVCSLTRFNNCFLLDSVRLIPYRDTKRFAEPCIDFTDSILAPVTTSSGVPMRSGQSDFWRLKGSVLIRIHKRPRKQFFDPFERAMSRTARFPSSPFVRHG